MDRTGGVAATAVIHTVTETIEDERGQAQDTSAFTARP
jgi:hypothetical protein